METARVHKSIVLVVAVALSVLAPATKTVAAEPARGLARVLHVKVRGFGGVQLDGWIGLPRVPAGTRVPVLLTSSPYVGYCSIRVESLAGPSPCVTTPDDPNFWSDDGNAPVLGGGAGYPREGFGVPPIELVRRGFAYALFSVRGTGTSGGCFEWGGRNEQRDQAAVVEWLARQPWSAGQVGMGGLSYGAYTAWQAAVEAPPALKTIVTSGLVTDLYTQLHSPQGAAEGYASHGLVGNYMLSVGVIPPAGGGVPNGTTRYAPVAGERVCPETSRALMDMVASQVSGTRDPAFWNDRRLIDRFDKVKAAVLVAQGFDDRILHGFQESAVWRALPRDLPKRQIEGRWGHAWPTTESVPGVQLDRRWSKSDWRSIVYEWLDHFVKGSGPSPEHLGESSYQDTARVWRSSKQWPPAHATDRAVFLAGSAQSFVSVPAVMEADNLGAVNATAGRELPVDMWPLLCPGAATALLGATYFTRPLAGAVTVAGNPFAYLHLTSSQRGGQIAVHVLEIDKSFDCTKPNPTLDAHVISHGAADLQFARGNFRALDFPVGKPTWLRVDLRDDAYRVKAGNRIAIVVSRGEVVTPHGHYGRPFTPRITIAGDSHVVLPIVDGPLPSGSPMAQYPPRPFVPAHA